MNNLINRQAVLIKIKEVCFSDEWIPFRVKNGSNGQRDFLIKYIEQLPTGKLTNPEWIDFLTEQFDISRTSAKEMLHVMMSVKKRIILKKQFNGRNEVRK